MSTQTLLLLFTLISLTISRSPTILLATQKPFATKAREGIKKEAEKAGFNIKVLEGYSSKDEFIKEVKDVDALIIRSDKVDKEIFENAKMLKIVVRAGAGYDNVDLDEATKRGVVVMNTPGQNANAVAELTIGLMLYGARGFFSGKSGFELRGRKLGLLAFGNVGRAVARNAIGLGMDVYAFDSFVPVEALEKEGVKSVKNAEELFEQCDIVSLHIPANKETIKSIGKIVNKMPKNGMLINAARKEVINEPELLSILKEREDIKYLTDTAPDDIDNFKQRKEQFFATKKKMGAQTFEANVNAGIAAIKQIIDFFVTGNTRFQVNK